MRARTSLAAFLSLLLLAMSSWASACDLSCALMSLRASCPIDGAMHGMEYGPMHEVSSASRRVTQQSVQYAPGPIAAGMNMDHMAMSGDRTMTPTALDESAAGAGLEAADIDSCSHGPCARANISTAAQRGADQSPLQLPHAVAAAVPHLGATSLTARMNQCSASPPKLDSLDPLGTSLRI